jgi:hypothetical protein
MSSLSLQNIRDSFLKSYNGRRDPVVLDISALLKRFAFDDVKSFLGRLIMFQEVVTTTTANLVQIMSMNLTSEVDKLAGVCRGNNASSTIDPSTSTTTPIAIPASTAATAVSNVGTTVPTSTNAVTTRPAMSAHAVSSGGTNAPVNYATTNQNASTRVPSSTPATALKAGTRRPMASTTRPIAGTTRPIAGTTRPTAGTTAPGTKASSRPDQIKTPSPGSNGTNSAPKSSTIVAVCIGVGGFCMAAFVAVAYKIHKKSERFPAVITGGYAFEAEDRDIFDLEEADAAGSHFDSTPIDSPSRFVTNGMSVSFSRDPVVR